MAIYEMTCPECGHHEEELRTMAEGPRKECPKCGALVQQEYGIPTLNVNGKYSMMHPRKMRGNRGQRPRRSS